GLPSGGHPGQEGSQADVPSQSTPMSRSHRRSVPGISPPAVGSIAGAGATATPLTCKPPLPPTWSAVSSPCSNTSFSYRGGHRKSMRRPHSGQDHSSAPDSACPLRIISCVSDTAVPLHPVACGTLTPGAANLASRTTPIHPCHAVGVGLSYWLWKPCGLTMSVPCDHHPSPTPGHSRLRAVSAGSNPAGDTAGHWSEA